MTGQLPVDPETMKLGLLLEAAKSHQDLAHHSLQRLQAHTLGLDDIIRNEVRGTLINELGELVHEITQASNALRQLGRAAQLRALWSAWVLTCVPAAVVGALGWWWLPSPQQISALRVQQQHLLTTIAQLEQAGGRIDLRHCGEPPRLCVRVDRRAGSYGNPSDYLIVQGY